VYTVYASAQKAAREA